MWKIELLGGLGARPSPGGRGRTITRFQSRQTGLLLAYLASHPQRSLPREELIELLWPECDVDLGRHRLSQALSSLRHQLEPPGVAAGAMLAADRRSVRLNPEAYTTDVAAFEAALRSAAQAGTRRERLQHLQEAVELYRGELLPGYFEEWCLLQRESLREQHLQALHQLVAELEQDRQLEQALSYALRIVAADPLREEAYRDAMRLSAALGQPSAALQHYRELERRLREELDEAPSTATRQLAEEIRRASVETAALPPRSDLRSPEAAAPHSSRPLLEAKPFPPLGTVTFLFTDIEGSTALWERTGDAFREALERHHALLRGVFRRYGGFEFKEAGDGFLVGFETAAEALECAVAGQRALAAEAWPEGAGPLRVRMVLHTGDVTFQNGDCHGLVLHHASRMLAAAHGGQILCSEVTAGLLRRRGLRELEPGLQMIELGAYRLRDVPALERLFQVSFPGMVPAEFPPLRAEPGYASHLPPRFTRFFGRETEVARLRELLAPRDEGQGTRDEWTTAPPSALGPHPSSLIPHPSRLVSLTGPGGTGKTCLALEVAAQLLPAFHGAVWFAPLEELADPALIIDTILSARHLDPVPGVAPLQRALQELSRQPTLLVLDNFEQLLPAGAAVVQELLEGASGLTCLVTSRRTLNLAAEREFPLDALATPGPTDSPEAVACAESVQLFVDRAQAVRPDFQVTRSNAAAIAELCRRLEGIPLALELAAARAQVLTPAQLVQQLQRQLDLLVGRRSGVARHRTLRATIDWSYQLLSPELQQFFAQLSVFRGSWSLEAAEAVTGEALALDYLMDLRENSLIQAEAGGAEMRFRMLESLRQYAAERVRELDGGDAPVRQRHAAFFDQFASEQMSQLRTPGEAAALERLEADLENVRAAADWAERDPRPELWARLPLCLGKFLQRRGFHREALRRTQSGLDAVLRSGGTRTRLYGELLHERAGLHLDQQEWDEARRKAEKARAIFEESGDALAAADADNLMGLAAKGRGDFRDAGRYFTAALRQLEQSGDLIRIAGIHNNLGVVDYTDPQGDLGAAAEHWQESLRLYRLGDFKRGIADVLTNLGALAQRQEAVDQAWASYHDALQIERELHHSLGVGRALSNLGEIAELRGEAQRAFRLFAAAEAIFAEIGSPHQPYTCDLLFRAASHLGCSEPAIAELRASLRGQSDDDLIRWAFSDERR